MTTCTYPGATTYPSATTYPGCSSPPPPPAPPPFTGGGGGAGTIPPYVLPATLPYEPPSGFALTPMPTRDQVSGLMQGAVTGAARPLILYGLIIAGAAVLAWAITQAVSRSSAASSRPQANANRQRG